MKGEVNEIINVAIWEMGANIPGKGQQENAGDKDISEAWLQKDAITTFKNTYQENGTCRQNPSHIGLIKG